MAHLQRGDFRDIDAAAPVVGEGGFGMIIRIRARLSPPVFVRYFHPQLGLRRDC